MLIRLERIDGELLPRRLNLKAVLIAQKRPVHGVGYDGWLKFPQILLRTGCGLTDERVQASKQRPKQTELTAAKKRIRELENEVAILKRARELLREPHDPKGGTRP